MENRFGVKDFINMTLLVILIVSVWLSMKQNDRHFEQLSLINTKLTDLGRGGFAVSPTTGSAAVVIDKNDPFREMRKARAQPDFAEGDWIVEAFPGTVAKLTPLISHDLYSRDVHYLTLETLVTLDADTLEYLPLLAESWTMDDNVGAYNAYAAEQRKKGVKDEDIAKDANAPVPLTITFTLRDGICFSDGKPIRPEDFVFSFKFTMDKRIAAPQFQAYLEKFKSVEKGGEKKLVVKFREPYYDSLGLFTMLYCLPEHFYSQYTPEKFNESTGLLLGSGPYRLEDPTSWRPGSGQPITLVRNERYWGVRPALDRFLFKEFTNDIARQTAYRNGEVDLFEARPEQYHVMKQDQALVRRSHHFDWLSLNGGYRYVAWQQLKDGKATFFADKRVRQAMAMLVDRQRLVQEVMLGYAELATGPFSPAGFQIDKSIKPVPYDVAGGRKLLADAGFTDKDGDGVLEKDGRAFRFKLTYPSGSANYEKMVLAFKDAYARVGIVLEPDPTEWGAFSQKLRSKDFEAVTLGWGGGNPESDVYQMFHSKWTQPNGDNFMCYINPELDKILEEARTTVNKEKRIPLWHKAHKIFAEDQPYMFLWFTKETFWVDGRLKNVRPTPLGLPSSLHTEWYVPRDKRKWAK